MKIENYLVSDIFVWIQLLFESNLEIYFELDATVYFPQWMPLVEFFLPVEDKKRVQVLPYIFGKV